MLKSRLASIVNICTHHAWAVIAIAVLLTVITGTYSVRNFAINTDVNKLISPDLPWRQRELAVEAGFPHRNDTILAVVEAGTSEMATQATEALCLSSTRRRTYSKRSNSLAAVSSSPGTACCSCRPKTSEKPSSSSLRRSL